MRNGPYAGDGGGACRAHVVRLRNSNVRCRPQPNSALRAHFRRDAVWACAVVVHADSDGPPSPAAATSRVHNSCGSVHCQPKAVPRRQLWFGRGLFCGYWRTDLARKCCQHVPRRVAADERLVKGGPTAAKQSADVRRTAGATYRSVRIPVAFKRPQGICVNVCQGHPSNDGP